MTVFPTAVSVPVIKKPLGIYILDSRLKTCPVICFGEAGSQTRAFNPDEVTSILLLYLIFTPRDGGIFLELAERVFIVDQEINMLIQRAEGWTYLSQPL